MTAPISHHEQGAALLTVLIVVGVIGAIAAVTFDRLRLATMLATNNANVEQARSYAMIAETLAKAKIDDLVASSPGRTTLAGGWQGRTTTLPLPAGTAQAKVRDGGNCFNLNSLVTEIGPGSYASRPVGIDQFARLMAGLGIPAGPARRVADSAADWIDSDGIANPDGAEDPVYARADPAYRTGNTLMSEASELRAVNGVTPAIYGRVRPWLCALPTPDLSPINVNTLTAEQTPLLVMLFPLTMNDASARRIIAERPGAGWSTVSAFWNTPTLRGFEPPGDVLRQPQVRTMWFALDLGIVIADSSVRESALIDARTGVARVASRRWTEDE